MRFTRTSVANLNSLHAPLPHGYSMATRRSILPLVGAILMGEADGMASEHDSDLEVSVCGFFSEPLAFWSFRSAAGKPDARRIAGIRDLEAVSFQTVDGRQLRGYKLRAASPRGYVLIAQGNAMLADHIIGEFESFRDSGLDVYVYDYRGYGLSEGKSRLKAIVSDYRELVAALNAQNYQRRYWYGMSMGGVILLNAVGATDAYDAAVVDSSPSRVSWLGCPKEYDPVNHMPADGRRIKLILGLKDRVVPPAQTMELETLAARLGARIVKRPEFAHPFQDASPAIHQQRLLEVVDFFQP